MTTLTRESLIERAQARLELMQAEVREFPESPSVQMDLELARITLASLNAAPVAWTDEQELQDVENSGSGYLFTVNPVTQYADPFRVIKLFTVPPAPVVPDEMLCDFYEVSNWPDLVRELVKHVEQLQDSAKRNVKPWEDTFPATLLPAYIDRIKQADEACRAAMLQARPTNSRGLNHANDR